MTIRFAANVFRAFVSIVLLMPMARAQGEYATPESCQPCHQQIWETYRKTGMGRSFHAATAQDFATNNAYFHQPSDSYFWMLIRGGKYFEQRYQLNSSGKHVNVMEKQVDFIMGSGNHARTYLHRTERNTLVELPLGWYAEKGGSWAMNPGYDRPNHDGFRRPITYDCMFCHNAYPKIPAGHDAPFAEPVYDSLPQGIDCQRCHGPGGRHVLLAKKGAKAADIRSSVVNPSRLDSTRQMEICMVCHLETTSFPLPNAIQRYERGAFSFQPGEPLGDFILNFDHAPGTGHDDKFELVNAAYRLRRSECFLKSAGKLTCTTCHNPHDAPRGEAATRHYDSVCRGCHAPALDSQIASGKHPRDGDCAGCHMPKRRTEDVVHVIATDHYIQRRKPAGDLLAEIAERHQTDADAYRGPVALYYPEILPPSAENNLYLAIAQVSQNSNLNAGLPQLARAIENHPPQRAEYYFELGEAWRNSGQLAKSVGPYQEAVRKNPNFLTGLEKLGFVLRTLGRFNEAEQVLERAVAIAPDRASAWQELGMAYRVPEKSAEALATAIRLDPDMPEAHNNLGVVLLARDQSAQAEAAFREAIRIQPSYADAHGNLANLLSQAGDFSAARDQFEIALRLKPTDARTRYNYAMALGRARHYDPAQRELEKSLGIDPRFADAHQLLADLLMARGQTADALPHYREVVRLQPESGRAHLGLAAALLATGDKAGAESHLQKAAADPDPSISDQATQALRQIGKER